MNLPPLLRRKTAAGDQAIRPGGPSLASPAFQGRSVLTQPAAGPAAAAQPPQAQPQQQQPQQPQQPAAPGQFKPSPLLQAVSTPKTDPKYLQVAMTHEKMVPQAPMPAPSKPAAGPQAQLKTALAVPRALKARRN